MTRPKPTTLRNLLFAAVGAAMIAGGYMLSARANSKSMSLPVPAFAGGTKAITLTPVVGTPRRKYAEMFVPGEEQIEDGELRVPVLQCQDLTVINLTKEAVVSRQAKVVDQFFPAKPAQRIK